MRIRYEESDAALAVEPGTLADVAAAFEAAHRRLFGFVEAGRAKVIASVEVEALDRNIAAMAERKVRAYLAPGRSKHGQDHAAGDKAFKNKPLMSAMAQKLKRAGRRSRYRLRKQTVEPVFGQIKQARGFRQFTLRGLEKVRGEWAMICTAHNLLKLAKAAA